MRFIHSKFLVALVALVVATCGVVYATTYTWDVSIGQWEDCANWVVASPNPPCE